MGSARRSNLWGGITILMIICCCSLAWPDVKYGGGTGEPNDPYQIWDANDMQAIGAAANDWDKCFRLMADVDLSGHAGEGFNIIGTDYDNAFTGVFDGNGHTISNFSYSSSGTYYIGLFGYVRGPNAAIKDLGLIQPNVDAETSWYVGSLVGYLSFGTISNCFTQSGSIKGGHCLGGLVGENLEGSILESYSEATVWGRYGGNFGGLVGRNYSGVISSCYAIGNVTLLGEGNSYAGGLVGFNRGIISNCYARGDVEGTRWIGGLVGNNAYADSYGDVVISNSYSSGNVSGGRYVGGLSGYNDTNAIAKNSFWDIETSGQTTSAGGTGLPTAKMKKVSTFTDAGWDFVGETVNGIEDIWFIPQEDYPHLWWEGMEVSMKLTPRTLNCRSKGNWVRVRLTLPEGFTVADVDCNRPAVLHSFGFESGPLHVFVNENELVEIEAAFDREAVCSLAGDWPEALTVVGFLTDGNIFLRTSTIRMITHSMKEIEDLASCWLQGDRVHPIWCGGIDMNRDSIVNLLDYALLQNSQVEFISK